MDCNEGADEAARASESENATAGRKRYVPAMKITSHLFEAFLKCPTKCHLRSLGETGSSNEYAEWVRTQNESYEREAACRLQETVPETERVVAPFVLENLKTAKWQLAVDIVAQASSPASSCSVPLPEGTPGGTPGEPADETSALQSRLHAVERIPSEGRGKTAQFIPIRFIFRNKLTKDDRLLLTFDVLVLSQLLGREVSLGKIIHGDDHATLKVKTSALAGEVRKRLDKIAALLSSPTPPDLVLNRHCAECEFQPRCRKIAIEKDDLSLLAGMSAKERQKLRGKGIFTVTQLSYTFRPRRTPKRAKNPAKPRYLALQALAIRENTVYIHGAPTLLQPKTQVYMDIEGLPDRDFCYLIGALVVSDGHETFHSFWADTQADESGIFAHFVDAISQLEDCRVFHFGDYDTAALKRMKLHLSESHQRQLDAILGKCTNVLSALYPHVYFPGYSNSLKEIERFLGFERSGPEATGLQSVIWRMTWSTRRNPELKATLADYNRADCNALKLLTEFVVRQTSPIASAEETKISVRRTTEMNKARPHWQIFRPREYALEEFKKVVKCSYFDHQREKVFVRTDQQLRAVNKQHRKLKRTNLGPNSALELKAKRCRRCGSKRIEFRRNQCRVLLDLKFMKSGVKKWIIRKSFSWYYCFKCHDQFNSWDGAPCPSQYGHGLLSWCVYMNSVGGMNMNRVRKGLGDLFGLFISQAEVFRFKRSVKTLYESLYADILRSLLLGPIIHIDETVVNLRGQSGYVWVIASMDKVYYFYRSSREGEFLQQLLGPFNGILISDFFTAYDSLPCRQQKCLAHLIRDIDEDVFHNPLDTELKSLAHDFGRLLKRIISTVDKFGLKRRHLHKHEKEVRRFLKSVGDQSFSSQVAIKYEKRFERSGFKMFTFLEHDGVPWNNTNAEHAIKAFAKYRRDADGRFTEASLKEYLVLASVFETCAFNNVNVLKFLLSKETTLDALLRMAGRKRRLQTSQPSDLPANANRDSGGQP
jgi:predicted RecB family nuclease